MDNKPMFIQELEFFIANQEQLVSSHLGKILAIKGQQVIGVYDNLSQAYFETQKITPLGTFMLQPCQPGPDAYTVTITSQIFIQ